MREFGTITEAEAAGYSRVRRGDVDVSRERLGPGAYGYHYRRGPVASVTIYVSGARNAGGHLGAYVSAFKETTEEARG